MPLLLLMLGRATQHSAGPALLPPPHWRGKRGSPLPTSWDTAFIWGDIAPDLIGSHGFVWFLKGHFLMFGLDFLAFTWVQPRFLHQKSWCVAMMSLSVRGGGGKKPLMLILQNIWGLRWSSFCPNAADARWQKQPFSEFYSKSLSQTNVCWFNHEMKLIRKSGFPELHNPYLPLCITS